MSLFSFFQERGHQNPNSLRYLWNGAIINKQKHTLLSEIKGGKRTVGEARRHSRLKRAVPGPENGRLEHLCHQLAYEKIPNYTDTPQKAHCYGACDDFCLAACDSIGLNLTSCYKLQNTGDNMRREERIYLGDKKHNGDSLSKPISR